MTPDPVSRRGGVPRERATLGGVVVALTAALCALLLLRWLAVVALVVAVAAVLGVGVLRWAREGRLLPRWATVRAGVRRLRRRPPRVRPAPPAPLAPDCSWCGRPGGHRDRRGDPVRPRHAHALR